MNRSTLIVAIAALWFSLPSLAGGQALLYPAQLVGNDDRGQNAAVRQFAAFMAESGATLQANGIAVNTLSPEDFLRALYGPDVQLSCVGCTRDVETTLNVLLTELRLAEASAVKKRFNIAATGDVRKVAEGGLKEAATGSLRLTYFSDDVQEPGEALELTMSIAVAGIDDVVLANHGSSILSPTPGRNSTFLQAVKYSKPGRNARTTRRGYLTLHTTTWGDSVQVGDIWQQRKESGAVVGLGGLVGREIKLSSEQLEAAMRLEAGLSARILSGTLATKDDGLRAEYVSDRVLFLGPQLDFTVAFQNITLGTSWFLYLGDAEGVSRGRITGGVSITTSLFQIDK